MTTCSTKGHEKVPAVETLPVDGKERPLCGECSERWKLRQRARA